MPDAAPSLADALYRPFFLAGIAVVLTLGAVWGAYLLLQIGLRGSFVAAGLHEINAHGHAQIFGWVGLFVMGFAYQAFPRFKHTSLVCPQLAVVTLVMLLTGLFARSLAQPLVANMPWLWWIAVAGSVLEIVAVTLFVALIGLTWMQSGKPLLMNDPHRVQGAPSLRYWSHLVAPGWNVIGGGEPMLPGVSIGHNEVGAWGLTIFGTDGEDLYVYETNPANPNQYRYRGGWEDMRVVKDSIAVKGEAAVSVDLKYTRHGPVLFEDAKNHKAYALRAAWMEIGGAPYLASLRMDQATTWEEFREACAYSRIPAENMVWADVSGTIGYQAVAITPIRRGWSGLVPVPGDGRFEWDGYLPIKALPNVKNPEKGFYATANNYLFPPDYPYPDAQHHTGTDPYRVSRITEFLGSGRLHSVAEMVRLQNDDLSIPARSLVPLLKELSFSDPAVAKAQETLLAWDYVLDKSSVAAGVYEMFQRRLLANMRDALVPAAARADFGAIGMKKIIELLYAPDGRMGEAPIAARDKVLTSSLEQAVAELTKKLGPDMAKWQYGQYHHALIQHPLSGAVSAEMRKQLDVGPMPRGGDSYTVTATGGTDNQVSGGSLKMVADLDDWDASVALNNPGQSGDPKSPHYRDLFELWSRGKYFPIFYSRPRVESVTERTITLQPASAGTAQPQ